MTNEEIAKRINELTNQFVVNQFTLQPGNDQINKEIEALRKQCTHIKGTYSFEKNHETCQYCGRRFSYDDN